MIGCGSFFIALFINFRINKKKNHLLETGEVIWAKIDKKASWVMSDEVKVTCRYFKENTLWLFEARYTETDVGIKTSKEFYSFDIMPVIVNPLDYSEYIVLLEEMLLSVRKGLNKPIYFTKIVRSVSLPEVNLES